MPIYKLLYGLFDNNSVPRLLGRVLDTHLLALAGKPRRAADLVGGIVGVQRRGVFLAVNRIFRLHDILHIAGIIGVGNIVGILLNRDNGRRSVYKSLGSEKGRKGAERKSDNGEDSRKFFQPGSF